VQTIIEWLGTWIDGGYGLTLRLDLLVRLMLAVVLGGAIAWEREASESLPHPELVRRAERAGGELLTYTTRRGRGLNVSLYVRMR
jgi:hypothetical protein